MLVVACTMPMGTIQTRAIINEMKNAHQLRWVGNPSTTPSPMPIMITVTTAYHQIGTL